MDKSEKETIDELLKKLKSEDLDYREIIRLSNQLSKYDTKYQRFVIDAKTLIHLGRDSIKDHTTALLELVKNSYDADAKNVIVEIYSKGEEKYIRVADNGFGMKKEELLNNWLRIGFSNKRQSKLSNLGRRRTGEKGIGRISTDRLGSKLVLKTKSSDDKIVGLKVDWDDFDTEGKDVFDINVEIFEPIEIDIPKNEINNSLTGTEIIITNLRQNWTEKNVENLYNELSSLTPPFEDIKDFSIELKNDILSSLSKKVSTEFLKAAEIELTLIYDGKGKGLLYTIKDKHQKEEIVKEISWQNLIQKTFSSNEQNQISEDLSCGPVTIKLLFFLRSATAVADLDFKLADLREFLNVNAGLKIYRDNVAVKPYGFPSSQNGFDWLSLAERKAKDPGGIGREDGGLVLPYQIVGAIYITRDNNIALTDSAAREGLVESEAFNDLKNLVMGSIVLLETHRADLYQMLDKEKETKTLTSSKEKEYIRDKFLVVKAGLNTLKEAIQEQGDTKIKDESLQIVESASETVSKVEIIVEKTITELLAWNRVLSGLATLGISSAVFGHETENSISQVLNSTHTAKLILNQITPNIEDAVQEIDKALAHSTKVSAWGAYALTRVQKEKRSKKASNITRIIEAVVKELKPAFMAASIEIKVIGEMIVSKTYVMDIESILINLLTNSYTAATQKPGDRKVKVEVAREDKNGQIGYYFAVSDSGPGVAKEFRKRIFDPLFSTKNSSTNASKSVGTGLGLTIVSSIVAELKGTIEVDIDPILKGARFKVWLPKEK
ncbi:sensor histidine kinase [Larkinella soli]|uniref:sensor histidine kinase n=1 Tax=Larkinella soli TaxID=1770527 RepID=UPI000FFC87F1|nr:sensor histidine kinase [Larkinella soli]